MENEGCRISRGERQLLSNGVDPSCFGLVLQPVAHRIFIWQRKEWVILEANISLSLKNVEDEQRITFYNRIMIRHTPDVHNGQDQEV